jgi:hypothetical protein
VGTSQTGESSPDLIRSEFGEKGGGESKEKDKEPVACQSTLKAFFAKEKGTVKLYESGGQQFVQAGKTRGTDLENGPGVHYLAAVDVQPEKCAEVEFVQNVQTSRIITFKDASKLQMVTRLMLDGSDPYGTTHVPTQKTKLEIIAMNDSPSQGTGGVFGLIEAISVKESFKLFIRAKGKKEKIVGLAIWDWNAEAITIDKKDDNALLKLVSGDITATEGTAIDGKEEPKKAPRIQDESFEVVGKAGSYASRFEKLFGPAKHASGSFEAGDDRNASEHQAESATAELSRTNEKMVRGRPLTSLQIATPGDGDSPVSTDQRDAPETIQEAQPCRPKLKKIEAVQTGAIAMMIGARGEAAAGECLLSFGMRGKVGMTFRSEVDVPEGCTGRLEYVQLVDTCRQMRDANQVDYCLKSDGFVLDTRDPQVGQWVNSSGAKSFESSDSPAVRTQDNIYVSARDYFHVWLLWRADKPADSPRVPLGVVGWHWKVKANKSDKADKTGDTGDEPGKTGEKTGNETDETRNETGKTSDCAKDWTISEQEVTGGPGMDVEYDTAPIPTRNVVDLVFGRGTC